MLAKNRSLRYKNKKTSQKRVTVLRLNPVTSSTTSRSDLLSLSSGDFVFSPSDSESVLALLYSETVEVQLDAELELLSPL